MQTEKVLQPDRDVNNKSQIVGSFGSLEFREVNQRFENVKDKFAIGEATHSINAKLERGSFNYNEMK